nr:ABC transporter permease [Oscillospiraceae bacterium]
MKFGSLLKKELRELITPQVIFSMVFSCVMLIVMGQFMGNIMEDSMESSSSVTICNKDDTDYTNDMIKRLPDYGTEPELVTIDSDDYAAELARLGKDAL